MRNNLLLKEAGKLPEGYDVDPDKQRQGDVYLCFGAQVPPDTQKRKDKNVALGEVTGHAHTIQDGKIFGVLNDQQWIVIDRETTLTHQEHATHPLRIGVAKINIQREYTPQEIRRVFD